MNEMITTRDSDIVAAEINIIKKNVRQIMIAGALEIGGKLVEAKGMVPHGQWAKWLEEKVDYSQSTANNLMKLYQEYGGNQQSLFDSWTNSQTFAELSYTQHLALLALPFSERQEFAETHQVAEMSTRELDAAVREELAQTKEKLTAAEERADAAEAALADANKEANDYLAAKKQAEADVTRAMKSEEIALNRADKLQKQLTAAQKKVQAAEDDLKKARENPDVPADVMAALRLEVEHEAARKATESLKGQLTAAQEAAAKAQREKAAAEEAARVAAGKLEEIQKVSKLANPDMMAIQTLAENMLATWNTILGHRMKAVAANPDNAAPLTGFLNTVLDTMRAGIGEK